MKLSITAKLILLTTLLVAVTALTVTTYLYQNSSAILVKHALDDLTANVSQEGEKIRVRLKTLEKDVRFLSATPPIKGLIRADRKTGYDKLGASTTEQWKSRLSDIFKTIAQGSADISQIRLIDKRGNELVKVERQSNGELVQVSRHKLQNKLQRDYVRDSMVLRPGEVNLSRINLNREFGKITKPHILVLRAVTPVYSNKQQLFGLIVINIDFSHQLKRIENHYRGATKSLYITNQAGGYLSHPDSSKLYNFDLGHRYRLQEDFPHLANLFSPDNHETNRTFVPQKHHGEVMVFVKIHFDTAQKQRFLAIGLTQNYEDIIAAGTNALKQNIWIVMLLILTGIMLAIGFAGLLTTPLRQIVYGIDRLLKDSNYQLPVRGHDEIGKLASTLNQMAHDVRESEKDLYALNARLEDEVEERTHELHVNLQLVNTINTVQTSFISDQKPQHAFEIMLKGLLDISDSEYGFIGEILHQDDGAPFLKTMAITNIAWNEETRRFYAAKSVDGLEFYNLNNLFGLAMVTGEPVISNNPASDPRATGTPEGHPPLNAFLGIPIYHVDKLIGMAGVANRKQGYDEELLHHLAPFITTCANMIASIQARQEARQKNLELQQTRADLERAIKSSTAVFYTARPYGDFGATFISDNVRQQLGYEPGDFTSDPTFWANHIHPDDKEKIFAELGTVFETGEHTHTYRFLDKQGNYRWMQDELRLHRDEQDNPAELAGFWSDITERKQAELQLQESEFRHRSVIDSMIDAVITINKDARIDSFNTAAEKMFGYQNHEVLGKNINMLMPEPYHSEHDGYIANYHKTNEKHIIGIGREVTAKHRNGKVFPISLSVSEMHFGDEQIFTGVVRDITLEKQAEQAVLESEEKFRSVITSSPMGVFIYELQDDNRLIFTDHNPAANGILGVNCQQFIGKTIEAAFPALSKTDIPDRFRRVAREGTPWSNEDLNYDDNQNISGAFDVHAFQTSPGKMAVMFLDVTERLQAQEELIRFKTTLDMTNDCVLMFYPEKLELFYVNQGTIQQTGYAYHELLRMHPYDLLPELDVELFRSHIEPLESMADGSVILETSLLDKQGNSIDVELHLQYIHPSGEAARFVAIMRDITERKKVDRIKNEFVSTVSHELRTPLTSIRGALGLISGGAVGKLSKKTRQMLDIASNNTERLLLLINDILDIQKIESGELSFRFRSIPVMPLIEKAIQDNMVYADQYQVSFKLTHQLDNVHILADEDRMIQVLNNLMSNAVKFSSPGDTVELAVARHNETIRISVTDYGPGIPESFQNKLFNRFTQSDASDTRQKSGTGLGLSIAKAIMEKHGGRIDYITHPGVGTTMFVELPITKVTHLSNDELRPYHLRDHKPCLLIIEDDADVAALLQRMLAEAGYNSDIAYDAASAEEHLQRHGQDYKAITLDIELPDMNGLEFLDRLRRNADTHALPVVVVSAQADEAKKRLNGSAIGVTDWINKPLDEQRLIEAIRLACGNNKRPHILHVEDESDIHRVVKALLGDDIDLSWTKTVAESQKILAQQNFDLVLLDITLPDGSGLELIPRLEQCNPPPKLVIFSAHDVTDAQLKQVSAVISKGKTSNEKLIQTITAVLHGGSC